MRVLLICLSTLVLLISCAAADNATILYPTGNNITYNYNDEVSVTYRTPWVSGANLTLFCAESTNNQGWCDQPSFAPLSQDGVYIYHGIGETLLQYIVQFPVLCSLGLYPFRPSEGTELLTATFTMTSVDRAANTFQISSTYLAPLTTSITTTTASSSTTSQSTSPIRPSNAASLPTSASTTSLNSSLTPQPSSGGGLSTGEKAGIGVGAGVGVLLVVAIGVYLVRMQRRLSHAEAQLTLVRQSQQFLQQQEQKDDVSPMHPPHQSYGRSELPSDYLQDQRPHYESDGRPVLQVE